LNEKGVLDALIKGMSDSFREEIKDLEAKLKKEIDRINREIKVKAYFDPHEFSKHLDSCPECREIILGHVKEKGWIKPEKAEKEVKLPEWAKKKYKYVCKDCGFPFGNEIEVVRRIPKCPSCGGTKAVSFEKFKVKE